MLYEDVILTRKNHNCAGTAFAQGDSTGGSKLIEQILKQVISKPSNTLILCYLAVNASYVGFINEINFILIKMIILDDFS